MSAASHERSEQSIVKSTCISLPRMCTSARVHLYVFHLPSCKSSACAWFFCALFCNRLSYLLYPLYRLSFTFLFVISILFTLQVVSVFLYIFYCNITSTFLFVCLFILCNNASKVCICTHFCSLLSSFLAIIMWGFYRVCVCVHVYHSNKILTNFTFINYIKPCVYLLYCCN